MTEAGQQAALAELEREEELREAEREAEVAALNHQNEMRAAREAYLASVREGLESENPDTRRASFEEALNSDDSALRQMALETTLTADDALFSDTAIREALRSEDSRLATLALRKLLGRMDTMHIEDNSNGRLVMTNLTIDPENDQLRGFIEGNSGVFNCGEVAGIFRMGELSISNENCQLLLSLNSSGQLVGQIFDVNNNACPISALLPIAVSGDNDDNEEQ